MSEFTEKIILAVVDNLVLALIVAGVGLWINLAFERF